MELQKNVLTHIAKLYSDALNYYFSIKPQRELNYDDKPFSNLFDALYSLMKSEPFYNEDLMYSAIMLEFEKYSSVPSKVTDKEINELTNRIITIFEVNKSKHYLLVPLQGSNLKADCCFGHFFFISNSKSNKKQLVEKISEVTCIDYLDVKHYLDHTEKTRCKDFLQSNMLIIEIEDQTDNVRYSALDIGQTAVSALLLLHDALEIKEDGLFGLLRKMEAPQDEIKHVSILAKDSWRVGHGHRWDARLYCNINLDFLVQKDVQEKFEGIFDLFTKRPKDELAKKFYNSFLIYSKAKYQLDKRFEKTEALLMLIVALESLVAEDRNEKRLRLAATVPRLITLKDKTQYDLSIMISDLYQRRNNFMHSGTNPSFSSNTEELDLLSSIIAKVIMLILNIDSIIELSQDDEKSITAWNRYINSVFDNAIFGGDSHSSSISTVSDQT